MPSIPPPAGRPGAIRLSGAVVAATALVAVVGLALWTARDWRRPSESPPPQPDDDPRLTFATPYRNVRPDVPYLGSQACAECHRSIADRYARHPMGRSFAPLAQAPDDEPSKSVPCRFEKAGVVYEIERRDGRFYHKASRRGADGKVLFDLEVEVPYVMGSGTRGRSYLVDHDGFLFQSPVSWYAQKSLWDLAPGFTEDQLLDRIVGPQCMFCHCNDVAVVPHTSNRYREPLFREHAIGCERCHGPGALHAASPSEDGTIVNPAKLEPYLRDAVCDQCHLQAEKRLVRRDREVFDYRPGLPLHLFWSVFVRPPDASDPKAVSHTEQMRLSRCGQASGGKLGCISCHDPHSVPPPERKAEHYRARCLKCHQQTSCTLAPAERRRQLANDDCAACHMQRLNSADIVHTAITDHRVPRKPSAPAGPRPKTIQPLDLTASPLVHFHKDLVASDDPAVNRDLAIALVEMVWQNRQAAQPLLYRARPLLDEAVKARPDDVPALEAKAHALWLQGRDREGLALYEEVLRRAPERETTVFAAAVMTARREDYQTALGYWRRAVAVNPWRLDHHVGLAQALIHLADWPAAAEACRQALRLNPARLEPRALLVQCLARAGERDKARAEYAVLQAVAPPEQAEQMRHWFDEVMK